MPKRAIFAYDPLTRVNEGYGVYGTSGSGGAELATGGGKCGIADGGAVRNAGHDVKPMLARWADVVGAWRHGKISTLTGKISH